MRRAAALGCVAAVGLTAAACGGGSGGSATATGSSAGAGSGNTSAYCTAARQFQQAAVAAEGNHDQIRNAFSAFDQVAAKAPSQIRSSAQTLRSSYQRILSALGSTDLNQNPQALTTAASTVVKGQETRLASAGQQVTDYTKRTCGVDFSASGGSTTTTKP
ncbi:MAG: hypothetical protein E6G01_07930 [Actinobacteria bacterium]|nr:MAG: hypothetical protein E6G01_07930 [Actinomycetota bacterium]